MLHGNTATWNFWSRNCLAHRNMEVTLMLSSHSVVSDSETPWTAAKQASLSITIFWSLIKLMSIESVMPSNHLILCYPLLLLPSIFPSTRVFLMSQLFSSSGWSTGVSASVLPLNIQDWFPLRLTALITLQSKGLSSILSNTTVQKYQFFGSSLFMVQISHP